MALLAFQKPDKVIMLESSSTFGKFEFRPLEPGFGNTIGNAMRRILLSSLEGYAITSVKIDGVQHEFDTIPGVIDDVTSIILRLKQVRFKCVSDTGEEGVKDTIKLHVFKKNVLKAGDFNDTLTAFEVLNPDLLICEMDESANFNMELTIEKGRGYLPADENKDIPQEIGTIAIDAIFTPIRNVKYAVEPYRVEQRTDYDKLVLEITTDGSVHPKEALKEAAHILIQHFMLFSDEKISLELENVSETNDFDEEVLRMRQLLKTKLIDLDLSVRALNCLKAAEVFTLGDLCKISRAELLKFRNFGKKSLTELDEKLASLNLSFGMDLAKYKLDKD